MGATSNSQLQVDSKNAFDGKTQTHRINLSEIHQPEKGEDKIDAMFHEVNSTVIGFLTEALQKTSNIYAHLSLKGTFDDYEYKTFNLDVKRPLSSLDMVQQYIKQAKENIRQKFNKIDSKYKGDKRFLFLYLHIHEVTNSAPKLKLPKKFEKHIIDCKSDDEMSFIRSVLLGLRDNKSNDDVIEEPNKLEEFSDTLNLDDIDYPVQLDDIPRIEDKNSFSINVYMLKFSMNSRSFEIEGPVYHTQRRKEKHINLLLLHDNNKIRYYYIKDLKSLINRNNKDSFCDGCLNFFNDSEYFKLHQQEECLKVKTTFSSENTIKFRNQMILGKYAPIVVYADFNILLQPIDCEQQRSDKEENAKTWTKNIYKHVPYSYWYYIKCIDKEVSNLKLPYKGLDCVQVFMDSLIKDLQECLLEYRRKHPENDIQFIPVFFHDLQNYDGHFILQASKCNSVIDKLQTYFAIYKKITFDSKQVEIRFLDSCKFLNESIITSVNNLEQEAFREIKKLCENDKQLVLLTNKIEFPLCTIRSVEDLQETEDHLSNSQLTKEEDIQKQAKAIWNEFKCKTIGDYLDCYLQTQVLLLADVFEHFRRFCIENYKLDPAYYYSLAGFSWDAMLKDLPQDFELELLNDVEMLLFIKKGVRGGYKNCNKHHAIANNKYLELNDEIGEKRSNESYITCFDANNAYGYAMCKALPYGGFEWVKDKSDINECINLLNNYEKASEEMETGYILEVDLSYPAELHQHHSNYPFCPQKKPIDGVGHKDLIADLKPKSRYVIHYRYLALCLKHGLKIDKVHRVLKFKQTRWLQKYIEENNEKRIKSKNASQKLFFKMLNITVYGKTILNVQKFSNIVLFDHWENKISNKRGAFDYVMRPDYKSHIICSNNMVEIKQFSTNLTFKYPTYVGFSILDLAKTRMYEFYYDFMKEKFSDKLSLLYTDNDSFIFHIKEIDCYKIIEEHGNNYFDTSGYEENNIFGITPKNRLKMGYFNDVMNGAVIKEYVGLKPKMYILEPEKAKVKRSASDLPIHIRNKFEVEHYKSCLMNPDKAIYETFCKTGSVDHDVYTQEVRKKCLSL